MPRKLAFPLIHALRSVVGTSGIAGGIAATQAKLDLVAAGVERTEHGVEWIEAAVASRAHAGNRPGVLELVRSLSARFDAFQETWQLSDQELADRVASIELIARDTAKKLADIEPAGVRRAGNPPSGLAPLLVEARRAFVRTMPPGANRMLSFVHSGDERVGLIERAYGPVREHICIGSGPGRPDGLPANVTWLDDSVGLAASSCDLLFMDQTAAPGAPTEVASVLPEFARLLRPGGSLGLVIRNPEVAAALNRRHPERRLEMTAAGVAELMRQAGFDLVRLCGIWLCRDPRTCEMLPVDPERSIENWSVIERILVAHERPDHSLLWWIEAARPEREAPARCLARRGGER